MDGLKARLSFDAVAYDYDDEYLTIDTDTHIININNVSRLFGVQYDGNSKLIKFRISNKLSDIQKMQDSIVYINWIDSKGVKGQSIAINKTINNDTCEFAWKVPFDALKNSGVLHFAMSAVVTKNSSSVIDQRWSTQIASVTTPDGIYIKSYTPSSEEEDRIAQIYNELSKMINKQNDNLSDMQAQVDSLKEDLDTIRIKYANLLKINPNIQDVSVSNGYGSVYVNENYIDVDEGKPYFVYVKFKITNLTNFVQGTLYARLIYNVDAGGWEDYFLSSIKNDGEYLICYNFTAKKSGKVGMQLYFNNQIPSTNTFSCQCIKLFVAQTSDNIKEKVDSEEQTSGISKVILKSETVTWDNLTNDVKKKIERTPTNFTIIDCWGDSLTQGAGATNYPYPTKLQELIGSKYTVNNYGQGSETAEVIAFRQGGMGAIVLPFTASANVSDYNKVTINSVDGASLETMSYSGKYYGNDMIYLNGVDKWMFRRGDNNSLNLLCTDQSLLNKKYSRPTIAFSEGKGTGHIVIICIGQNGWAAQTSRPEALADIIQKMVEHNGTERYIVVGRPTGNKDERNVEEIILASRFSDHFVNARAYISEYGLSDNNLSPTQEDTEAISSGAIPPQLKVDGVHMNDYGYIAMANCVYQRGVALNYWS